MADTLLDLHSGSIKLYSTISHYDHDYVTYDLVTVVNSYNQLLMYVVNRSKVTLHKKISIPYLSSTIELLKPDFPFVSQTTVELNQVFGMYDDAKNHVTLFLQLYHRLQKTIFLIQVDMDNFDISTINILPVENLCHSKKIVLGIMSKKDMTFTDAKIISIRDTYIMIVNTDDPAVIGGKSVEGIRVLMTDEEKQEFSNKFTNITLPDTKNPVVDIWNEQRYRFYNLPKDTTTINVSFSTGMAVVDLN